MTNKELKSISYLIIQLERINNKLADTPEILQPPLLKQKRRREKEVNRLTEYINSIEDERLKDLFVSRYIEGNNWIKVAADAGGPNTADTVRMQVMRYLRKHPE